MFAEVKVMRNDRENYVFLNTSVVFVVDAEGSIVSSGLRSMERLPEVVDNRVNPIWRRPTKTVRRINIFVYNIESLLFFQILI